MGSINATMPNQSIKATFNTNLTHFSGFIEHGNKAKKGLWIENGCHGVTNFVNFVSKTVF